MSQKFPKVTAAETIKVIERVGFVLVRQSGSHMIYKNKVGKRVTIPFHDQKILHPKVLKSILRDAELSVEEFLKLIR